MSEAGDHQLMLEESYMTPATLAFFRQQLLCWREELTAVSNGILVTLKESDVRKPDPIDCSSLQADKELNLLSICRNSQIILQIEYALRRIQQGKYGYCEMTGEEIGIERLKVMPLATLSVEAQEEMEKRRRPFR